MEGKTCTHIKNITMRCKTKKILKNLLTTLKFANVSISVFGFGRKKIYKNVQKCLKIIPTKFHGFLIFHSKIMERGGGWNPPPPPGA